VMPLHQAPLDGSGDADFHFFVGFLPPLRQPNLLKFLAGPEIGGGNFLSDTSPEDKAAELRAQSTTHWRERAATTGSAS
jgi:UDPglucose--hexose-1-phosphate uridylyltransferase